MSDFIIEEVSSIDIPIPYNNTTLNAILDTTLSSSCIICQEQIISSEQMVCNKCKKAILHIRHTVIDKEV